MLVVAAIIGIREPAPVAEAPIVSAPEAVEVPDLAADDPSLTLIADLAGELDWDGVAAAGLTSGAGSAERLLLDMSDEERLELQRILKQELAGQGA
jgi:hypothetical protein